MPLHSWDLLRFLLTLISWTPSHLLHESAILRDQACPISNKGGCFDIHVLFVIYKPDLLDQTAHFRPPPSHRLATNVFIQQLPHKVKMRLAVTAHPLMGKNRFVQLNECFCFLSLQTSFVRLQLF